MVLRRHFSSNILVALVPRAFCPPREPRFADRLRRWGVGTARGQWPHRPPPRSSGCSCGRLRRWGVGTASGQWPHRLPPRSSGCAGGTTLKSHPPAMHRTRSRTPPREQLSNEWLQGERRRMQEVLRLMAEADAEALRSRDAAEQAVKAASLTLTLTLTLT